MKACWGPMGGRFTSRGRFVRVRGMLALVAAPVLVGAATPDYAGDAAALDRIIVENYAYPERLGPDGRVPDSPQLAAQRAAVHDSDSLLRYAENRIASLADHHAITGSAFDDSWALVPSYADLWIVERDGAYRVDAVRPDTPAARAGVVAGDRLVAVDDVPIDRAIAAFWQSVGVARGGAEARSYAARVLAAGRRDRPRRLTFAGRGGTRELTLATLYADAPPRPPLRVITDADGGVTIRINNALGDQATIAAFDRAVAAIPASARLTIDLTDTPGGGNTSVARAMIGWFVTAPTGYQVHRYPAEERETGIPRQWIEQVLPRAGKSRPKPVAIRVGRWTGSMGEGIAIAFAAIGVPVCGDRMAGLLGAVYDFALPASGLVFKLPAERLYAIDGRPREDFVPIPTPSCPARG